MADDELKYFFLIAPAWLTILVLRLAGEIDWAWWVVLTPLIAVGALLVVLILLLVGSFVSDAWFSYRNRDRLHKARDEGFAQGKASAMKENESKQGTN